MTYGLVEKDFCYSFVRCLAITGLVLLLFPVVLFAQPLFAPAQLYTVSAAPISVIAADLDGDGDSDLVTANYNGNSVSVLMNTGNGTFTPKVDYTGLSGPFGVFAADLDGDEDNDLMVASYGDGYVAVLKNDSHGNFGDRIDYVVPTGIRTSSVIAADLDGDGYPELIAANRRRVEADTPSISIWKNNGDGTFCCRVDSPLILSPGRIIAADLDNDGDKDLCFANHGPGSAPTGNTVTVFENNGFGVFSGKFDYPTGTGPWESVSTDLDGDGDLDVAAACFYSTLSVLKNNGESIFTHSTFTNRLDYAAAFVTVGIAAADLDEDGRSDLAVASVGALFPGSGDTVSVFMNNGGGTFGARVDLHTGSLGPSSVVAVDVDGDGDKDLVMSNWGSNTVSVLRNLLITFSLGTHILDFGTIDLYSSKLDSVRVTNPGAGGLNIISVISDNPAEFSVSPSSGSIDPFGETTFHVTFTPAGLGLRSGNIVFVHDGISSPDTLHVVGAAPGVYASMRNGWNLVSIPVIVSDYRKDTLFRTSVSSAFAYEGSYELKDTLSNRIGYWLNFGSAQNVPVAGLSITEDTIDVVEGWNLIGSISLPVATTTISSIDSGMVTSEYFGYNGIYFHADTIQPGKGYWVKVDSAGKLILSGSPPAERAASNRIRIVSTNELPPPPLPEAENSNPNPRTPNRFILEQNYPNPFNPLTVIRYSLPVTGHVTLKIYNVLGQEVAVLIDEIQDAGYKSVEWDASGVPSGLYFYRITAGNYTTTQKTILMK